MKFLRHKPQLISVYLLIFLLNQCNQTSAMCSSSYMKTKPHAHIMKVYETRHCRSLHLLLILQPINQTIIRCKWTRLYKIVWLTYISHIWAYDSGIIFCQGLICVFNNARHYGGNKSLAWWHFSLRGWLMQCFIHIAVVFNLPLKVYLGCLKS